MAHFSFQDAVTKLQSTPLGKEAAMYGPLRDILVHVLEYPASDVDIDVTGEGGRPDVTARAPSGLTTPAGTPSKIDWIVVEAKDEPGCFAGEDSREKIFSLKAKYVGPHTAWFVMVDPTVMVLRPVAGSTLTSGADIVIPLHGLTEGDFKAQSLALHYSKAGVSKQLERFRQGDTSLIATEVLTVDASKASKSLLNRVRTNRRKFFQDVREATSHLQQAVAGALARQKPAIAEFQKLAEEFWKKYQRPTEREAFDSQSLTLHGSPQGPAESRQHDRDSAKLRRQFSKNPSIARLALRGLPEFQNRTGVDDDQLDELFSIETANLILARVLLLRFFEDHQFFGPTRYVCNGGVSAFQQMRSYFHASYARLLQQAYEEGGRLYASAFDETELDWIFGIKDEPLSSGIEWTLFRFARYDFKTVRGDILTGIYDRFMDRDQRKKLGEFYTPPSIARFMLKHLGVNRDSRVMDPACGSGTFLIEAYRAMVGEDVDRGAATYVDVLETFGRIAGNDLNTFSSVLAQIQLLWQVLPMKAEIESHGFPDLRLTGKVNSLVERDQWAALEPFADIDQPEYDAVVGNPPYVRAERSAQALDKRSQAEFERPKSGHPGISSKLNAYALFLYRALDRWCRPLDANGSAGKVAFILPVAFFDSQETGELRQLFRPGARWAIREVIDLEVIYRKVFDADVLPAILIAENQPAKDTDKIIVRFADHSCVKPGTVGSLPEFDLEGIPAASIPYPDLYSPDGRILTRLSSQRSGILRHLRSLATLDTTAKEFWVRKQGSKIVEVVDAKPKAPGNWEPRKMIGAGVAFRGGKYTITNGIDIYKGENIIAAELQGDPALASADISRVDDQGLWRYAAIHPSKALAVPQVAHTANGVVFDPRKLAFTNTATILMMREDLSDFPFDLVLMSNIYVWAYAIGARMGVLRQLRSHIYPTNLGLLPWSDDLVTCKTAIEAMRSTLVTACKNRAATKEARTKALEALKLGTFKKRLQADKDAKAIWAEVFDDPTYEVEIANPHAIKTDDGWRVQLSADMLEWVECNREEVAKGLAIALRVTDEPMTKAKLLNLSIPATSAERDSWAKVLATHNEEALEAAMKKALAELDAQVATGLGLKPEQVAAIQKDMEDDPFLAGIRPRYPGTITRKSGFRTGLDSAERYQ